MELPELFVSGLREWLGKEDSGLFLRAMDNEPVTSIRLNPFKYRESLDMEHVPWASDAWYLRERSSFTADPLFHAGAYYVQEASSMFLEQFIKTYVTTPAICLDLCAAPGGKSTHLSSILPEGSLLVSNEVIRSRAGILAENLIKWGNPSTMVTNNDPSVIGKFFPGFFDLIVADVPCSGEGMFRKDKNAVSEWSPANVRLCAERQRRIIADIWHSLKPGGKLIYSTCTFNTEENEENVRWMKEELGAGFLDLQTDTAWNITGPKKYNDPVFRFIPGKTQGEGFFIAGVYKPKEQEDLYSTKKINRIWISFPLNFLRR